MSGMTANSVSSHNDPVPRNILFDGRRLWLIDWESAYRNDPLVDVAITLDNLAPSPALEAALLHAWLGRRPDEAMLARLALVRAFTRLYYAGVFLSASAAALGALADRSLSVPTVSDFRTAIRDGRLAAWCGGNQAHPGEDVSCRVFHGRCSAGARRRRLT